MLKNDMVRLKHMLDAAKEAAYFANGRRREDLNEDRMLVHSLVRCIEIIGEAATNITTDTKKKYPEIPWPDIIGMRNRLIHAYFDIDQDRIWDTIIDDIPPLIEELEKIISVDLNSNNVNNNYF